LLIASANCRFFLDQFLIEKKKQTLLKVEQNNGGCCMVHSQRIIYCSPDISRFKKKFKRGIRIESQSLSREKKTLNYYSSIIVPSKNNDPVNLTTHKEIDKKNSKSSGIG
jgi:hypothetical protein